MMNGNTILGLILCQSIILLMVDATGNMYCKEDKDCEHLGGLKCIKTRCEWGECGCPNYYFSKYIGREKKLQCLKLKKVGEKCSPEDTMCVPTSSCNETTNKCECEEGWRPVSKGEKCERSNTRYIAESCLSGADTCNERGSCAVPDAFKYSVNSFCLPVCVCPEKHQIGFGNAFNNQQSMCTIEVGPQCIPILHGDPCKENNDCNHGYSDDMVCNPSSKVCVCQNRTHVPSYDKTTCKEGLAFGEKCKFRNKHCDGSQGLTCGDACALTGDNTVGNHNATCTCGPFHTSSGTSCTPIKEDGPCYGDYNCKGWSISAVCVDGKCKGGAQAIAASSVMCFLISVLIVISVR